MKDRISTIIISIVIILVIIIFGFFGYILFQEFNNLKTSAVPENAQTVINENTIYENIKIPEVVESALGEVEDSNTGNEQQNVDYTNILVDKYFYNQLEEESKTIYRAFESNKENMKSGTYKVELGNTFSNLLSTSSGQDQLGKYYQSAIEAYTYDNPDVFYLSPNKMYLNIQTTTIGSNVTYNVYIDNGNENNYLINEFSSKEQVQNALNQIGQKKNEILQNKTGNDYDDIKMVHDYIINNVEYDETISKDNIYNIYGTLINGEAVCEGYARSFKYLMDELEIRCVLVIGKGINSDGDTENHAWNYVYLDGKWYAIDCTWDDPISQSRMGK